MILSGNSNSVFMKPNNSGNVLFLILIAVALFAALSYAITSSTRSGSLQPSKEKAQASAAALFQYGSLLKQTVLRLKMRGNCTDNLLDFGNLIYKKDGGTYVNLTNSGSPSNKSCSLFDMNGGQLAPVIPSSDALIKDSPSLVGQGAFRAVQIKGVGTDSTSGAESAVDVVFWIPGINLETCLAVNDMQNVSNPSGIPPVATLTGTTTSFNTSSMAATGVIEGNEINGHPIFCANYAGSYILYQVLVER